MPETSRTSANDRSGWTAGLERRGLFAAAWAAVAGLILKATTRPVAAAAGMQFQDVAGGTFVQNSAGGPTSIFGNSGYSATFGVFTGITSSSSAMVGVVGANAFAHNFPSMACGVYGIQSKNVAPAPSAGVVGEDHQTAGVGVWGRSGTSTTLQSGVGVRGESGGGIGVLGLIPATSNANATAVYGQNFSNYAGPGPGAGGFAVYGLSARGHGLVGATAAPGGAAVVGASNGVAGAFAAAFYGPVIVGGDFTVVGGAKSAAVPHPDGSHRRVYCVESPESWFEDFGKGQLVDRVADVRFDPDFAAIVKLDEYHVFLTGHSDHEGLYVADHRPDGFTVRARGGSSCASFSWRVVARRRDVDGPRLAAVAIPPAPQLPDVPDALKSAAHPDSRPAPRPEGPPRVPRS
jgi:hypothetical protein